MDRFCVTGGQVYSIPYWSDTVQLAAGKLVCRPCGVGRDSLAY